MKITEYVDRALERVKYAKVELDTVLKHYNGKELENRKLAEIEVIANEMDHMIVALDLIRRGRI